MLIKGEEFVIQMNETQYHSVIDLTMGFIGGKWKPGLLWHLRDGKKRFSELSIHLPDITEKMLSTQLKALMMDGLVKRKAYAEVPPRVEYELTDEGKTLLPVLEVLAAWGNYKADQGELVKLSEA